MEPYRLRISSTKRRPHRATPPSKGVNRITLFPLPWLHQSRVESSYRHEPAVRDLFGGRGPSYFAIRPRRNQQEENNPYFTIKPSTSIKPVTTRISIVWGPAPNFSYRFRVCH